MIMAYVDSLVDLISAGIVVLVFKHFGWTDTDPKYLFSTLLILNTLLATHKIRREE